MGLWFHTKEGRGESNKGRTPQTLRKPFFGDKVPADGAESFFIRKLTFLSHRKPTSRGGGRGKKKESGEIYRVT